MSPPELADHEVTAIELLGRGPHTIGVVDSTEKLAAALTFARLKDRGLVGIAGGHGETAIWMLTPAGAAILRRLQDR